MRGNCINIKGNITRDAEIRHTNSGRIVASWGIAWNSSRKNANGDFEDVAHFFDVQCWMSGKQAQLVQGDLVKGARCAIVDGHLEQQRWEKDGQNHSRVVVCVDDPINGLLVFPPNGKHAGAESYEPIQDGYEPYSDIPF